MTTNMTRGEPTVHQDGLLWKLVRASMTIVGLVPPVYENGELLIDGGYLNNMPVDIMRGLGVDTVSARSLSCSLSGFLAFGDTMRRSRHFLPL
jgi:lysophospholipid hydrolase